MAQQNRSLVASGPLIALGALSIGAYMLFRARRGANRARYQKPLSQSGPHVIILGAGFAGLTAAKTLRKRLGQHVNITLIDQHNYHLFTPMLFQVAAVGVQPYDVAFPIRQFAGRHAVEFRRGTVTDIDFDRKQVQLSDGAVPYDYLVIALGTTTNFFGNQSAQKFALPLKALEDAIAIRHQVIDLLDQASYVDDPNQRKEMLSFVVVGGGATGVETAGALADLFQRVIPMDFPRLSLDEARVLVVEAEGKLLGHMKERTARIAERELKAMGVEVWLNVRAKELNEQRVTLEDGRMIPTRTVIWATGVRAPDVIAKLDAPHGKGGSLTVDQFLQVEGRPGVYAIGDVAHFTDPKTHAAAPLLAEAAWQEGEAVAKNIALAIQAQPQEPFHYRSLGNVVSLGRSKGAMETAGVVIDGMIGWLGWRVIHLARLTSYRNKLATALDWTYGFAYDLDTARLDVQPAITERPIDRSGGASVRKAA